MTGATLVVGLGHPDRGDDGVGPAVARVVADRLGDATGVRVVAEEDPAGLLDLWENHDVVVVVDAVVSGDPAGTIHWRDLGAAAPPLSADGWAAAGHGGTHAFGLATAVGLARALHRLPAHVFVIGVEAGCLDVGAPFSLPVAAAVDAAAALVWEEVATDVPGRAG